VLSIGKLRAGAEDYYLGVVATGTEEYYTGAGETPGRWVGTSATRLGLAGEVDAIELRALLAGRHPRGDAPLAATHRKITGFDLTFSAPKSASILYAFGGDWVRDQVTEAHEAAVEDALGFLERGACVTRRGHGGQMQGSGDGFIGAAFRHRTSRAGDPQLHTHVLVANLALGEDDRWTALDARPIYRHARTAGYLYQARVRRELTARMSVNWQAAKKGMAEAAGLDPAILRAFSTRRAEIEAAMLEHRSSGRASAQVATLATRSPKSSALDERALHKRWAQQAVAANLEPRTVDRVIGARRDPQPVELRGDAVAGALTEERSTFDRLAVIRCIAEQAQEGGYVSEIEELAETFLTRPDVLLVRPKVWTTREMVRIERAVVDGATGRLGTGAAVVPGHVVNELLRSAPTLGQEQREMVAQLTTSGNGVDVVLGVAGSGKTHALAIANNAWLRAGLRPRGAALAARAAKELNSQSAIPSQTVDSLLRDLARGTDELTDRTVLVVDEAGMLGTRKLARLLDCAERVGSKVVLVGDDRQLPEIEAGGAFRGLANRLPTVRLTQSRRQAHAAEINALTALRTGRAHEAVEALENIGGVTTHSNPRDARAAMVERWIAARSAGEDAVMLATRKTEVAQLNREARNQLIAAGTVAPHGIEVRGREFSAGDRIVTLSNWHRAGIINGTRGEVVNVTKDSVTVQFDHGERTTLPPTYLRAGHLDHSYAMTIHKAQGMTTDRSLVLADNSIFREAAYTALSRGVHENHLFIVAEPSADGELSHAPPEPCLDRADEVIDALGVSRAKSMAIDNTNRPPPVIERPPVIELDLGLDLGL